MMNRRAWPFVWLTAMLSALLVDACGESTRTAYSRFENIAKDGWDPADVLVFEPYPSDSTAAAPAGYEMTLVLRYSPRSNPMAVPVALMIEDETGVLRADTLAVGPGGSDVSYSERRTLGVREYALTLEPHLRLTDGYSVTISPLAPRERTAGLLNVGIILKRNTLQ